VNNFQSAVFQFQNRVLKCVYLIFFSGSLADDGDNSVFEGSEGGSSVPRTPTEGTLTPVSTPAEDPQR